MKKDVKKDAKKDAKRDANKICGKIERIKAEKDAEIAALRSELEKYKNGH